MQTMRSAVDDFELELEPLVRAPMLADWDAAVGCDGRGNEQQLVEASTRVEAVLSERERYERLVEADARHRRRELARRSPCRA